MYKVQFVLSSFDGPSPEAGLVLNVLLQALTSVNILWLRRNQSAPSLYASGVRYKREPQGREDWQDIPETISRRDGDCEDLACWRSAELIVRHNIRAFPVFRWRKRPTGILYHIQVQYPDGRIEDPSKLLGM